MDLSVWLHYVDIRDLTSELWNGRVLIAEMHELVLCILLSDHGRFLRLITDIAAIPTRAQLARIHVSCGTAHESLDRHISPLLLTAHDHLCSLMLQEDSAGG
jgi:hypothetical protein